MNVSKPARIPQRLLIEGAAILLIIVGVLVYMIPRFLEAQSVRNFSGEVHAGETFEEPIGRELTFYLVGAERDWDIVIGCNRTELVLTRLATPPFYGVNPLQLEGWHFRNADNTGPNDGSVNAPQHRREFFFFTAETDLRHAEQLAIDRPGGSANLSEYERIPRARGVLTITDMELSPPDPGQRASIEWIRFEVELHWP